MALSYLTRAESTANLTTYTFSAQNLGVAETNRQIIVAVHGRRGSAQGEPSTCTVNGVSASKINARVSANGVVGIFIATVPTGTTGDVVVTFATDQTEANIALYRATYATYYATGSEVNEDPLSATITTIPALSILIGVATVQVSATATWTGATENYDDTTEASSVFGASIELGAQTNYVLSCDHTATSSDGPVMVWAVFTYTVPPEGGSPMLFGGGVTIA